MSFPTIPCLQGTGGEGGYGFSGSLDTRLVMEGAAVMLCNGAQPEVTFLAREDLEGSCQAKTYRNNIYLDTAPAEGTREYTALSGGKKDYLLTGNADGTYTLVTPSKVEGHLSLRRTGKKYKDHR